MSVGDIIPFEEVSELFILKVPIHFRAKEPGFRLNGRSYTRSSDFSWTKASPYTTWEDSALYCLIRDTNLQTLDDAVEFRHGTNGADKSNDFQHTRTLLGYTNDGRAGLRAFLWEPSLDDIKELVKHPQIGNAYLQFAANDALAKQIKYSDKTFLMPAQNLKLSVAPNVDGESAYSSNEIVQLFMPKHAKDNAACISKFYRNGIVWFDRPDLSKGEMRVRPVGLGDIGYTINLVNTYNFHDGRPARGVAQSQKISP